MRQVLIRQNENITILGHNKVAISSPKVLDFAPGLNIIRLSFPVEVVSGGELKFMFTLRPELSRKGLLLVGSDYGGGEIETIIYNLENRNQSVEPKIDIIEATAYETLKVVAVAGMPAGVMLFEQGPTVNHTADVLATHKPPKTKKARKKIKG